MLTAFKGKDMRFAGNLIWFVFGGWQTALLWILGAFVFALSIVGLPLTRAAIEMAKMSAWPFGKEVVHVRDVDRHSLSLLNSFTGTVGFIANIVWALTFGLALFVLYLLCGILYCITIIGIPFGLQMFKLAAISLWPVGRRVVTIEAAKMIRDEKARDFINSKRGKGASGSNAQVQVIVNP